MLLSSIFVEVGKSKRASINSFSKAGDCESLACQIVADKHKRHFVRIDYQLLKEAYAIFGSNFCPSSRLVFDYLTPHVMIEDERAFRKCGDDKRSEWHNCQRERDMRLSH